MQRCTQFMCGCQYFGGPNGAGRRGTCRASDKKLCCSRRFQISVKTRTKPTEQQPAVWSQFVVLCRSVSAVLSGSRRAAVGGFSTVMCSWLCGFPASILLLRG